MGISKQAFYEGAALHQLARNEHPVYLIRALKDAVYARIAICLFRGIISRVTVTAKDLHHFIDHIVEELRTPDLQDGALDHIFINDLPYRRHILMNVAQSRKRGIHQPYGAVRHGFGNTRIREPFRKRSWKL